MKTKFVEIKDNMKLGLISDVHGNGYYLEVLLKKLLEQGVTNFLLLGDMVTDFPDTRKVMDTIKNLKEHYNVLSILGNREVDMLERKKGNCNDWDEKLHNGILLVAYNDLTADDLKMIESWPENYVITFPNGEKALVTHRSLLNDEQKKLIKDNNIDILLFGDSHRICDEDRRTEGDLWYVNPGSVGLNEDSVSWGGTYGILNIDKDKIEYEQHIFQVDPKTIEKIYKSMDKNDGLRKSYRQQVLDLSMKTGRNIATIYFAEIRRLTGLYDEDENKKIANGFYKPLSLPDSLTSGYNIDINGKKFYFNKDYETLGNEHYHKDYLDNTKFPSNLGLLKNDKAREEIYNVALNNILYYSRIFEANGLGQSYIKETQSVSYKKR